MKLFTVCAMSIAVLVQSLAAQTPPPKEPKEPTEKEKEELDSGIPITNELVRKTCSPCHKADDKLRLSRISWRRTTPEGWEQTIKRMISLDGLKMEPADAGGFLEDELIDRRASFRFEFSRQDDGGTDVGMARERDLDSRREDANVRGVTCLSWR